MKYRSYGAGEVIDYRLSTNIPLYQHTAPTERERSLIIAFLPTYRSTNIPLLRSGGGH